MDTFKARGIILKENIINDKDKVLTILLKDYGKCSVWAKNSLSIKSKLKVGTSLFSYSDFIIFDSKKNLILNQVDLIENFFDLSKNLDSLAYGNYFLEIIDKSTQELTPVNNILLLLLKSLLVLSKSTTIPPKLVAKIFEIKLLQLNGYMPCVTNCCRCDKNISLEKEIFFNIEGPICLQCKNKNIFKNNIKINDATIKILNYIISSDLNNLYTFNVSPYLLNILASLADLLIEEHLFFKLNSKQFITQIENT